jgi:hypothetical protein
MIIATGNNFGAGLIQLKDYQNANMVILNGRISIDPTDEAYIAAQQLEIYVPDLSLPKSTLTAVFQHGKSWAKPMVTALKSWIKDKNTIVVEKPLVLKSAAAEPVLDFLCAYVPKGIRFTPEGMTPTTLAIEDATLDNLRIEYQQCFITEGWVFLAIQVRGTKTANEGDPFSFRLAGLPSGLSADVPFFFNAYSYTEDGSYEVPMTLAGDLFSCEGVSGTNWSQGGVMETRVFIVR